MRTSLAVLMLTLLTLCLSESFYDILGVKQNADENTLSLKYHPDHGGDKNKFLSISKAYKVLQNKKARQIYDRQGEGAALEYEKSPEYQRDQPSGVYSEFANDIERQPGGNIDIEFRVTLTQLLLGDKVQTNTWLSTMCSKCFGTGAESEDHVHKCGKCDGTGVVTVYMQYGPNFVVKTEQKCSVCHGKGTLIKKSCPRCQGRKMEVDYRKSTISIEKGMKDGDTIVLEGEGDESVLTKAGSLVFKISTVPHEKFFRRGNDLHFLHTITLKQALLGFEINIEGLAGEQIRLKSDAVIGPGQTATIKGKGMPTAKGSTRRGDAVVTYEISFPAKLTSEQKETLKNII